jgi:hypothetical protein
MRQQSAIVVSEYLPSFETRRKTSTRDDQPCLYSPLYRRPLWNTVNLLVMYMDKYKIALGEMTIYLHWDRFTCLKWCEISKLEHNHTDTCLAWSGDPTNTPQIHSHGIWCVVGKRIINETTICHRGKWIPAFLWKDAENLDSRRPTMSLLSIIQETSVKYSEPSCNVYG